jgi:hypothetical protein
MLVKTTVGDKGIQWLADKLGLNRFLKAVSGSIRNQYIQDGAVTASKLESASDGELFIGNGTGFTKATITAGANVTVTNTSGGITIASTGSGGGGTLPPDGGYGDVTVSSSGTVWTIDNDAITTSKIDDDAVTYAKIQNVSATNKLLGRSTAGAGDIEEITCTSFARTLLDDADNSTARNTLGLGTIATQNNTSVSITGGTAILASLTLTNDLAISDGGTGASTASVARNNLLPSQAASSGEFLRTDGTNVAFEKVPLGDTTSVSGTLAVANGGTGSTTSGGALANLLPSYTGKGSHVLALNSGASATEWVNATSSGTASTIAKRSSTGSCQFSSTSSGAGLICGNTSTGPGAEFYNTGSGSYHALFGVNGSQDLIRITRSDPGIQWFYYSSNRTGLLKTATLGSDVTWTLPSETGTVALRDMPRGQIYFQNNASTKTLSTTYSKVSVAATLDSATAIDFTMPANSRLEYDSGPDRKFNVIATIDVENTTGASVEVSIKLAKNGSVIDATQCNATVPHNGVGKLHSMWMLELASADYIEVFLASASGTPTVIPVRMRMQITSLL